MLQRVFAITGTASVVLGLLIHDVVWVGLGAGFLIGAWLLGVGHGGE